MSTALEEARKAGEQLVLASVRQMNDAVERRAEDRVQTLKARLQREVSARGSKRLLELVEAGFGCAGV